MTPTTTPTDPETAEGTAEGTAPTGTAATPDAAGQAPAAPRKPRATRRLPTSDSVLEAAVERARAAVLEVAPESRIGRHVSAVIEGERLVTHRFEAFVPGYGGWQWYASVARVARSKEVTVCEVGLLPSAASLLAPEWLPWSERVRPEDSESSENSENDGVARAGAGNAGAAGDGVTSSEPAGATEDRSDDPAEQPDHE